MGGRLALLTLSFYIPSFSLTFSQKWAPLKRATDNAILLALICISFIENQPFNCCFWFEKKKIFQDFIRRGAWHKIQHRMFGLRLLLFSPDQMLISNSFIALFWEKRQKENVWFSFIGSSCVSLDKMIVTKCVK